MDPQNGELTLNETELSALAELITLLVDLDDDVTPEESDELALVARQVGEERLSAAMENVDATKVSVEACVAQVSRSEAQRFVYSLLEEIAASDGVEPEQVDFLTSIRHSWAIED